MGVALSRLIGERVRQQRQGRRWTLDELADASGVSRRTLINIEQGEANPSIGVLLKVGEALGVGLVALVDSRASTEVTVTRVGTGPVLWSGAAGGRAILVASAPAPNVVELWDWTLGAGDRHSSEAHTAGTHELLHVVEGTVSVEVGDQTLVLQGGDAVSFPGDVPHSYTNAGGSPARFSLSVFEPVDTRPRGRTTHA